MRLKKKSLILAFVLVSVGIVFFRDAALQSTEEGRLHGIRAENFDQVNPVLYRSGVPKRGDLERMQQLGIKTILDYRFFKDDSEENLASKLGLRYIAIPWTPNEDAKDVFDYDQIAAQTLEILKNPENQPVLIHCRHGRDRTGSMIGVYRIAVDGWSAGQAVEEMKRYGYRTWRYPNLAEFLHEYEQTLKNTQPA